MPTNLPPDYFTAEKQYREATSPEEKIACLEEMLSIVPKHKGTDHLRADLRRRLSKLKTATDAHKTTGRQASVYHIDPEGAGQIVLLGMANVGKSALVASLTHAEPEVAPYPYTTWTATPGMMPIDDIQVQLIDTPPLNADYVEPEFMNLVRRADLVLLVVDIQGFAIQQMEDALDILDGHRIKPLHVQAGDVDERRITYLPMILVANKADDVEHEADVAVLAELFGDQWQIAPVSTATGRNVDAFKRAIFCQLAIIRVYSKPPGQPPDMTAPYVVPVGTTIEELAGKVHRDFLEGLKSARIWGSATHDGQMVGRDYVLQDGDVVELRI